MKMLDGGFVSHTFNSIRIKFINLPEGNPTDLYQRPLVILEQQVVEC